MKSKLKAIKNSPVPDASNSADLITNADKLPGNKDAFLSFNNQVSILYVEDNVFNQTLGRKVLKNLGCICEIANSGVEALELLSVKSYDLVLMDINMPVLDGLETTKYIREKLKLQLPVIAVTTNCMDEDVENCRMAGMNDHVAKPYSQAQLFSIIYKWCKVAGMPL